LTLGGSAALPLAEDLGHTGSASAAAQLAARLAAGQLYAAAQSARALAPRASAAAPQLRPASEGAARLLAGGARSMPQALRAPALPQHFDASAELAAGAPSAPFAAAPTTPDWLGAAAARTQLAAVTTAVSLAAPLATFLAPAATVTAPSSARVASNTGAAADLLAADTAHGARPRQLALSASGLGAAVPAAVAVARPATAGPSPALPLVALGQGAAAGDAPFYLGLWGGSFARLRQPTGAVSAAIAAVAASPAVSSVAMLPDAQLPIRVSGSSI
jgi:hypothetical protein